MDCLLQVDIRKSQLCGLFIQQVEQRADFCEYLPGTHYNVKLFVVKMIVNYHKNLRRLEAAGDEIVWMRVFMCTRTH